MCLVVSHTSEMGSLDETLGTETSLVSVPVSVPPRQKMSGLVKVFVSRDFIIKKRLFIHLLWIWGVAPTVGGVPYGG